MPQVQSIRLSFKLCIVFFILCVFYYNIVQKKIGSLPNFKGFFFNVQPNFCLWEVYVSLTILNILTFQVSFKS